MEINNIKRILLKYKKEIPLKIFSRELKLSHLKFDKANIIVGPRKSGKTFFLYSLLKLEKNPVFVNFEDLLISDIKKTELMNILDFSKELFGKENLSFFFDEIQNIDGWENFIISLLNEHYPIYITGSNSKMLSKEIATALRGKALTYLMLPLSFKEYLNVRGITLKKDFEYTDKVIEIKKEFLTYLKYGGFPEIILSESLELKNRIVSSYFDSVLYKDLVDRLQLKNLKLVEITIKYILNSFGNTFSITSFENYLKSNKIGYSLEDLYVILRSIQDVFMASFVKQYFKSFRKAEFSKSKVYLFDTSYIKFLTNEPEDHGRILENIVFIELFRREGNIENKHIFYYKSDKDEECDFVILEKDNIKKAIQVAYSFNDKNREREINGLIKAMDFFKLKEGLILTYEQEDELNIEGKKIIIKPVWKWLLGL